VIEFCPDFTEIGALVGRVSPRNFIVYPSADTRAYCSEMYPCIEASKVKQFMMPNSLWRTILAVLSLDLSSLNLLEKNLN